MTLTELFLKYWHRILLGIAILVAFVLLYKGIEGIVTDSDAEILQRIDSRNAKIDSLNGAIQQLQVERLKLLDVIASRDTVIRDALKTYTRQRNTKPSVKKDSVASEAYEYLKDVID